MHLQLTDEQNTISNSAHSTFQNHPSFTNQQRQHVEVSQPHLNQTQTANVPDPQPSQNQRNNRNIIEGSAIVIQPSAECRTAFFSSTVKLYRLLQNSPFHSANIIQSRSNPGKGIQTVYVGDESQVDQLIKITRLGEFEVKCFRATSLKYKIGLIGPIEMDVNNNEIEELLTDLGYTNPKAERFVIGRGDNQRITKTMKIWLQVDQLPENVSLLYRRFPITPFVDKPWQCYKCQDFGHMASNCPNKDRCVVCAGNHNVRDCNIRENERKKCVNCGENHTANYGGCAKMKIEKKAQHVRAFKNISYRDAVKTVRDEQENRTINSSIQTNKENNAENRALQQSVRPKKFVKETSTQTTTENLNTNTNEKLAFCLLDLFISMLKADPIPKKCALISKAFSEHLGITVTKENLMSSIKNSQSINKPTPSPIIQSKSLHNRKNEPPKF